MTKLRVPSAQHLCRNWNSDPTWIAKQLVRLVLNPPTFSYELMFKLTRDHFYLGVPYSEILKVIHGHKRKDLRARFLEILPLLRDHFDGVQPDYFQDIEARLYGVGRGLMVPFAPPFIYGVGGQLHFPWLSMWRTNPIEGERLSLFVTIVDEILLGDPDLEQAKFDILDLSAPAPGKPRELKVVPASSIPRVTEARKREMLETFADAYFSAVAILESLPPQPKRGKPTNEAPPDDGEDDLFGKR